MNSYVFREVVPLTYNRMRSPWGGTDSSTRVSFVCDLRGLPFDISLSANVRYPSEDGTVAKSIKATLASGEKRFWLMNAGWTIIASRCKYDHASNSVTVECGEGEGLTNGGHSALVERRYVEAGYASPNFTLVEVIVGVDNSDKAISLARNTSTKVSMTSIYETKGDFDALRQGLKNSLYEKKVAFCQNDPAAAKGQPATLVWLCAILPFLWQCADSMRFSSLTHGTCNVSAIRKKVGPEVDSFCAEYAALLLDLYEDIQLSTPGLYDKVNGAGSYEFLLEEASKNVTKPKTFWKRQPMDYAVPTLIARSIFCALANVTTWTHSLDSAYADAVRLYEKNKKTLICTAVDISKEVKFDIRSTSSSRIVFTEKLKRLSDHLCGTMGLGKA